MSFKDIISQKKAKEIIGGQLRSGKIPHAYLFLGDDGVGRKKTALELAKRLNCHTASPEACDHCVSCHKIDEGIHPDVRIIDFAWQAKLEDKEVEKQKNLKIDTIRELQREINLKPNESKWKVFIIEPAEKITIDAANCLLKTLEEPPARTVLILLAKHKENLPATVVSRAQIIRFHPLSEQEIFGFLKTRYPMEEKRLRDIARNSEGSLARAIAGAEEKDPFPGEVWRDILRGNLTKADLLACGQRHAKSAPEFLSGLLEQVKADFRASPGRVQPLMESILFSQKLLERNVNPQMVLDVLLLKLNSRIRGEGKR